MKLIITESKMTSVLHKGLTTLFKGFDNIDYDWAEFNCGMGVCCDPYAIGFVLPDNEYNDYLFKLVDGEMYDPYGDYPEELKGDLPEPCYERPNLMNPDFNIILFDNDFALELSDYLGPIDSWSNTLLRLLNDKFGMDAKQILFV